MTKKNLEEHSKKEVLAAISDAMDRHCVILALETDEVRTIRWALETYKPTILPISERRKARYILDMLPPEDYLKERGEDD